MSVIIHVRDAAAGNSGGRKEVISIIKKHPTLGCCGLDCGLCPRYYTVGYSRCPGCCGDDFENKHPSCSVITCCVKKHGLEVCAECKEYPCPKFEGVGENDSFITHRRIKHNHDYIRQSGITAFIEQQKQRMSFLRTALDRYDDGRSKSYFCLASALLSLQSLDKSLAGAEKDITEKSIGKDDLKSKSLIIKKYLNGFAKEENKDLKLFKAQK